MPPQPLTVCADSDKENSPAVATPTAGTQGIRNKASDSAVGGDGGSAARAYSPLTPKSQVTELKKLATRKVSSPGVTASVLFDTHWAGAAESPHPIKDLSERHRDKLSVMEAARQAAVAGNGSPAGRVRELAAKLEASSSPREGRASSAPAKEPRSGLSSPAACHTPTPALRPLPSLRAHPLSESILEDTLPCLASTQLSSLQLPPLPESPTLSSQTTTTACGPDGPGAAAVTEAACNTDPPPARSSIATSCAGLAPSPELESSPVPARHDAGCNTEGLEEGKEGLVGETVCSSSVATSCELPATKAEDTQTVVCASEVERAGEVTAELVREVEELRKRLETTEAKLQSAREEVKEERRRREEEDGQRVAEEGERKLREEEVRKQQQEDEEERKQREEEKLERKRREEEERAAASESSSGLTPAAPAPALSSARTASPFPATPGSAMVSPYDPFALTHTVGRLRMAIQRQAQDHAELAEFAEAERSVIEMAEAELEEALKKERGRVNAMRKRVEAMRRESTGQLAKEQEARIELEASLRASEKQRKMLQARMDDMLREGKYTPDELQAALHNLRQSEAELGAVVEANKEMLHELAGVYTELKAHSTYFVGVPVVAKLLGQLQRWEKAREMEERFGAGRP